MISSTPLAVSRPRDRARPLAVTFGPAHAPPVTEASWIDLRAVPDEGRRVLSLAGKDVVRFLQGILSNDIEALGAGDAVAVTLLTPKGKIISDGVAFCRHERPADGIALAVPEGVADDVAARLDRHIIMDDVEVESLGDWAVALAWGGDAPGGADVRVVATTYPAPGWLVTGPEGAVRAALKDRVAADVDGWTTHRIASGTPAWGHEVRPDAFPPEVGFVQAVSYDKGCFMGQEPLARIHARGQVNRVMVRVSLEGHAGLVEGADRLPLTLASDGRDDAGELTSVSGDAGLAVVRRKELGTGDAVTVLRGPGELRVTVASGPLGDDPGVAGRTGGATTVALGGRR